MAEDWYYARHDVRQGPVSFAKLRAMAADGWLAPDDLVWTSGMEHWIPAGEAGGLFPNSLGGVLQKSIAGLRPRDRGVTERSPVPASAPPSPPERKLGPPRRGARATALERTWGECSPRHLVAAGGGFVAALGIAFTVIAQSRIALAFTLSGLAIAATGLSVEIGRLLGQAVENIATASREAADRRLRAKKLALAKQRLDVESARLAHEQAARAAAMSAAVAANQSADRGVVGPAGSGHVVVVTQPPVRRWSPGLAAVLSLCLPGLGQFYKGQILNGIVWFLVVSTGYATLIVPGLILHGLCVLGALGGNPWTEASTTGVSGT